MNRRRFLKITSRVGVAGAILGMYTWQVEPFWLEVVTLNMPIRNLPDHWIGKTVMQISDMHVGNRFNPDFLVKSMNKVKELEPDIVVYTGDFVSYDNEEQFEQLKNVMKHAVKGKEATIGILGNHDYGKDWSEQEVADKIASIIELSGVNVLLNDKVSINGLEITGLDDMWGPNFNPSSIMTEVDINNANIVLCHNPDAMDRDVWHGYNSWVLSGHTHGGQVKPPFLPPPMLPVKNKRYTAGQFDFEDGRTLYINRALGHLHQVRFNVRPEITMFILTKG